MPNAVTTKMRRLHADLGDHAYNCADVFNEAYIEATEFGLSPVQAHRTAVRKHEESVTWVRANVGLS